MGDPIRRLPLARELDGWVRLDNETRLQDALRYVGHVGRAVGSPDPDVVFADRRLNPPDE